MHPTEPTHHEAARHHETLILGAGPAGLQLGYYLEQAGRDYLILERSEGPGRFFTKFPRHRMLISSNKVYTGQTDPEVNLRWDWNSLLTDDHRLLFKQFDRDYFPRADSMVRYLETYARACGLKVQANTPIVTVGREDRGRFILEDAGGNLWSCDRLVVATGLFRPYVPPIPGAELIDTYTDVSVDPAEFADQRVLILGKGNSAFETAENLISTAAILHVASPRPVAFAWKTHHVGHLRAVNNNFLDTYQLKSQNAVLDATVERIERQGGKYLVSVSYTHAEGEREQLVYDRIIACTGFRFDDSLFTPECRPTLAIHDRFPAQTSAWESENIPDLYFAGTLMQMRDFKKVTSGFIHGFRYNVRALFHILEERYHQKPWPRRAIPATAEDLLDALVKRINRTSALWQQFGFLGDLLRLEDDGGTITHFEELPVAYIHETASRQSSSYFVLTLEFGKVEGDPFNIQRMPVPEHAQRSAFLHPVIRYCENGRELATLHLLENLYGEWRDPHLHIEPLREFLRTQLPAAARTTSTYSSGSSLASGPLSL